VARILLDRQKQFRDRLIEVPTKEMRGSDHMESRADAGAQTELQCGFDMPDRDVGLARPIPEHATD
jgi:hypothetical protein